jgi:hypothetical protein
MVFVAFTICGNTEMGSSCFLGFLGAVQLALQSGHNSEPRQRAFPQILHPGFLIIGIRPSSYFFRYNHSPTPPGVFPRSGESGVPKNQLISCPETSAKFFKVETPGEILPVLISQSDWRVISSLAERSFQDMPAP